MNDIVKALRDEYRSFMAGVADPESLGDVILGAVDEIERLRRDRDGATASAVEWRDRALDAEAEVERLKQERTELKREVYLLQKAAKLDCRELTRLEAEIERLTGLCRGLESKLKIYCEEGERLTKERDEVTEELADWRDTVRGAMNPCDDEQHCSCCPALRAEIVRLRVMLLEHANGARERGETCHVCRGAALAEEGP